MNDEPTKRLTRNLQKIGLYGFLWLRPNPSYTLGNTARLHLVKYGSMAAAGFQFERYGKELQFLFASLFPSRNGWFVVNPVVATQSINTSTINPVLNATNMGTYYRYTFTGGGLVTASSETRHNRTGELDQLATPPLSITNEMGAMKV